MPQRLSTYSKFGLPNEIGVIIFSFSFILLLAPYMAGVDLGIFTIPNFSENTQKRLKLIGPFAFFASIALFFPIWSPALPFPDDKNHNTIEFQEDKNWYEETFLPKIMEMENYIELCNNAILIKDEKDAVKKIIKITEIAKVLKNKEIKNSSYKKTILIKLRDIDQKIGYLEFNFVTTFKKSSFKWPKG